MAELGPAIDATEAIAAAAARENLQRTFSSPEFRAGLIETNAKAYRTEDSFQNFGLQLGMGTDNALSGSTYGFNPITRNRTLLEWMHRGSWLAGVAIDTVGDDMTKAGIEITSQLPVDERDRLQSTVSRFGVWAALNDTVRWGRLYGGALAVLLIDGQQMESPLNMETIKKGQFRGLLTLDRWQVDPSLNELIGEMGPQMGLPMFYTVTTNAPALRGKKIHYSRCIRMEGIRLPYNQRLMENLWSISVLERLYDRMVAFDSATQGAAQSIYRSYLRTYKIDKFRESIAGPPEVLGQIIKYVQMMRQFQGIEGITLLDKEDEFEAHQSTAFTGIADALMQFGQQIAGALQIPLVRLFGMSPAGFSATGESDLRTYYDGINQRQERDFRDGVTIIYRVAAASESIRIGDDFNYHFRALWQLTDEQKAQYASNVTTAVGAAYTESIIGLKTAKQELKASSRITGIYSSITDEEIEEASNEAPAINENLGGMPGEEGFGGQGAGGFAAPGEPSENMPPEHLAEGERDAGSPRGRRAFHLHLVRDAMNLVPGVEAFVENPKGSSRYPWSTQLPADYGFIRGTDGADGEEVDCFIGPERDADHDAWIINQVDPSTGTFDEHKVMLGYPTRALALRDYQRAFGDGLGAARIGGVTRVGIAQLSNWLRDIRPGHAA